MTPPLRRLAATAFAAALTLIPTAAHASADADNAPSKDHPTSSCFWFGPTFSATNQELNYAFPDSGALYWAAQFSIPAGAKLELHGQYAHARYQSLNSYDTTTTAPTAALNDAATAPDRGSHNPYLADANRKGEGDRNYTVTVLDQTAPATGAQQNTLYAGVPGQQRTMLIYRLYLPDRDRDITGGAGLPEPELHLSDGKVLTGTELCGAMSAATTTPPISKLPLDKYTALRDQPGKPATFPAAQSPEWRTFYNVQFGLGCTYMGQCTGTPARTGGQYSNIDNQYVTANISRGFGPVLVLNGTLPRTPRTLGSEQRMEGGVDLRYWSLCNNESMATTKVTGCLYDEQLPLTADRHYTIVASLPGDRPANATEACGVAWLPLSPTGDGAGHPDDGYLIMRNMMADKGFGHAVQDTKTPGDEKAVMGSYLPDGSYTSKTAFESNGCHPQG
ncbi:hypothetical protein ACFV4K_32675 [Nocardia sp. NPDC059764]|uniref:hypothetical protein n=1 Tax=Nocardia sp. NPDC059764 TaxID=3346939 RepID=UPI00364D832D